MTPRKIIIDTDPGQDDAAAIMLALASPELEVLGVTAVAGNVPLALTARNAGIVTEICGRSDIAVYAGADRPLARKLVTAEHVHGKTGLDGIELFEPARPLETLHAVDFIIETLRKNRPAQSRFARSARSPTLPRSSSARRMSLSGSRRSC
jgi:purine nucleosidase